MHNIILHSVIIEYCYDVLRPSKINKKSKTTYADICIKHNWMYAAKTIPEEWLQECVGTDDKLSTIRIT